MRKEKGWLTDAGHNLWWPQIRKDRIIETFLLVALQKIKGPAHMFAGGHHLRNRPPTHHSQTNKNWIRRVFFLDKDTFFPTNKT